MYIFNKNRQMFIVIDLIKLFIESHRNYFKVKMLEIFKQKKPQEKKLTYRSLQLRKQIIPTEQQSNVDEDPKKEKQKEQPLTMQEKLKYSLYEKYLKFTNNFFENEVQEKVNTQYIDLLYKNQTNNHLIRKFQERCHGKVRNFAYDVSSLYSKQEMKEMQSKMTNQWKNKFSQITQLSGNCTDEQLRQYFKIKAQVQENLDNINARKQNKSRVVEWLPFVLQKTGKQYTPLTIEIDTGKQMINLNDLFQKHGLNARNYLKKCTSLVKPFDKNSSSRDLQMRSFRKFNYIDVNMNKIKELLQDHHRVYQTKKRQSIFPLLRANEARQQSEPKQSLVKSKSVNEYKLAPLFKNDILNKKLEEKKDIGINSSQNIHTERLNDRKNSMSGRSRIDKIISQIISQRNLVVDS